MAAGRSQSLQSDAGAEPQAAAHDRRAVLPCAGEPEAPRIAGNVIADENVALRNRLIDHLLVTLHIAREWLCEQDVGIDAAKQEIVGEDDMPHRTQMISRGVSIRVADPD